MSLLLDALLLLIIILAIPVGVYRGGIREGFTAAGILLGAQLATEWAVPWGNLIGDHSALATDASRFLVAFVLLLLATIIIGYGSSIAFTYHPGPGGRLFGGILGLLNGVLFIGFIIDFVIVFLFQGTQPDVIRRAYLARGLSVGTGTILLTGCAVVIGAMVFGMLVRERDADQLMAFQTPPTRRPGPRQDDEASTGPTDVPVLVQAEEVEPVQIREVRHWEEPDREPAQPKLPESQWSQTWPRSSMGPSVQPPWNPTQPSETKGSSAAVERPGTPDDARLRDWLEQTASTQNQNASTRPVPDPRDLRDDLDG